MAKKPILSADVAVNMHTIFKKEYVVPADLEKAQKSENTTGQELRIKLTIQSYFIR